MDIQTKIALFALPILVAGSTYTIVRKIERDSLPIQPPIVEFTVPVFTTDTIQVQMQPIAPYFDSYYNRRIVRGFLGEDLVAYWFIDTMTNFWLDRVRDEVLRPLHEPQFRTERVPCSVVIQQNNNNSGNTANMYDIAKDKSEAITALWSVLSGVTTAAILASGKWFLVLFGFRKKKKKKKGEDYDD